MEGKAISQMSLKLFSFFFLSAVLSLLSTISSQELAACDFRTVVCWSIWEGKKGPTPYYSHKEPEANRHNTQWHFWQEWAVNVDNVRQRGEYRLVQMIKSHCRFRQPIANLPTDPGFGILLVGLQEILPFPFMQSIWDKSKLLHGQLHVCERTGHRNTGAQGPFTSEAVCLVIQTQHSITKRRGSVSMRGHVWVK